MGKLQLELSYGERTRRLTHTSPTATIGRSPDCDLVVSMPWVPARLLILQVDPPFARAKLLTAGPTVLAGASRLTAEWKKLRPGEVLRVDSPDGTPLRIRVSGEAPRQTAKILRAGGGADGRPDDFGVTFVTESPLDGRQGWLDPDASGTEGAPSRAPASAATPRGGPRRLPGRTLALVAGVMVLLIAIAAAFTLVQGARRRARIAADVEVAFASLGHARDLLERKDYVGARAELDRARAAAVRCPTLQDTVEEIDGMASLPAIRLGANGYELMESQWLPADTARAWREARAKDDPKIKDLEARAADDDDARAWDDGRVACEEALALMDAEPVKAHPRRGPVQTMLGHLKNEAVRDEMTAKGLVLFHDKWVTPQEQFRMEQTARGLVEYKGKWLTKADAFAAGQTDKGLVLYKGAWMTPDEAKAAQGYVKFEGQWVTPAAKAETLARRTEEERQRQAALALEARKRRELADQRRREEARIDALKGTAYRMSQEFVKDRLKAPASAQFAGYSDLHVTVVYADGWYLVKAMVDSQNGFGAMIRNRYICKLRPKAGGQTWEQETTVFLDE